ncbi:glycosyltransferase [Flammeovirga sp. EKP202]|uniref:glycosyltransferase n=1 Tax=Flammeovirga sp. EKP202 TaxID=2770592 RepID=UPI00165F34E8|nr:glycosyltransferase [Flammeovirga sp. EKP202]MBD0403325.1 glycosyltransferase [Flammeovirga sp. EKP202]
MHLWNTSISIPTNKDFTTSVTVVIALRNEEENIEALFESLQKQSYPHFQCIFINDHSEDNTLNLLEQKVKLSSHQFQVISLEKDEEGKKIAIRKGVELAQSELIITTDADCIHDPDWINTIIAHYHYFQKPALLSGPVQFSPSSSFSQKLMAVEFGSLILTGATSIINKQPNMCNAANLTFQREAFLTQNDYEKHIHIPTGDDEFLMHQIAKEDPTKIKFIKAPKAIVKTPPPATLNLFIQQRVRWASKWRHYENKSPQFSAVFIFLLHFSFLASLCSVIFFSGNWLILLLGLGIRVLIEYFFNRIILRWQTDNQLLKWIPFVSLLYPFYAFSIGLLATFSKYSWKNRKYNV